MYNRKIAFIYFILIAFTSWHLRSMEDNEQRLSIKLPSSLAEIIAENVKKGSDDWKDLSIHHVLKINVPANLLVFNQLVPNIEKSKAAEQVEQHIKNSIKKINPNISDDFLNEYEYKYEFGDTWKITESKESDDFLNDFLYGYRYELGDNWKNNQKQRKQKKEIPISIMLNSPLATLLNTNQITMTTDTPISLFKLQKNVKNHIKTIYPRVSDKILKEYTLIRLTTTQKLRPLSWDHFNRYTLPRTFLLTRAIVIKKIHRHNPRRSPILPTLYYIPLEEEKTINKGQLKQKLESLYSFSDEENIDIENIDIIDENNEFLSLYDDNEEFPIDDGFLPQGEDNNEPILIFPFCNNQRLLISTFSPINWRKQLITSLLDIFQQINEAYNIRKQELLKQGINSSESVDYLQEITGYAKQCIMRCLHDLWQEKWFKYKISSNIDNIRNRLIKSIKDEGDDFRAVFVQDTNSFIFKINQISDKIVKLNQQQLRELQALPQERKLKLVYLSDLSEKISFILRSLSKIFNHAAYYVENSKNDKLVNLHEKIFQSFLPLEKWQTPWATNLDDIWEKIIQVHHTRKMELQKQGIDIPNSLDHLQEITGYAQHLIKFCFSKNDIINSAFRLEEISKTEPAEYYSIFSQDEIPLRLNEISKDLLSTINNLTPLPSECDDVRTKLTFIFKTLSKIFNHTAYYTITKDSAKLTSLYQHIFEAFEGISY